MPSDRYEVTISVRGQDNTGSALESANRELTQLDRNARNAGEGIQQTTSNMDRMRNTVTGLVGAWAALQVGQRVGEWVQLGQSVNLASDTFTALTGGTFQADAALRQMRASTGGIIDDMTLMNTASQLLQTGLAGSAEEAARLQGLAVRLGAAVGKGPVEAIENLNAALLNNSFVRLDTLGISASRVRARVNELKDAGLDMNAAFAQAVLEQGEQAIANLGPAADASSTAIGRLTTRVQSLGQSLANLTFSALEDASTTLEQLILLSDLAFNGSESELGQTFNPTTANVGDLAALNAYNAGSYSASQREANRFVLENPDLASQFASDDFDINSLSPEDRALLEGFGTTAGDRRRVIIASEDRSELIQSGQISLPEVSESVDTGPQAISDILSGFVGSIVERNQRFDLGDFASAIGDVGSRTAGAISTQVERLEQAQTAAANLNNILGGTPIGDAFGFSGEQNFTDTLAKGFASVRSAADSTFSAITDRVSDLKNQEILANWQQELSAFSLSFSELDRMVYDSSFAIGGQTFFDPADVDTVVSRAGQLESRFEDLQALAETTDLVSDDDLYYAERVAEEARNMANEAERGAEAFANLSLGGLLGETSGGRIGELFDQVLADLEEQGVDTTELQSDVNLQTGRETELSQFVEQDLSDRLAAITERYGAEIGVQAGQAALNQIEQGRIQGLSEQEIAARATFASVGVVGNEQLGQIQDSQIGQYAQNFIGAVGSFGGGEGAETGLPVGSGDGEESPADEALQIQESFTAISELDFTTSMAGLVEPLLQGTQNAIQLDEALRGVVNADWKLEVPMVVVLDDQTGVGLGRNPVFVAAVNAALKNSGIDTSTSTSGVTGPQ